ncbi:MAG TPA: FAD binding domain-containing protein [Solirubrobacteraceae bacterium]|jgi:carbon-monoxide dehydrogenase medium subunit|nr:FAD binding domain-containing protein [Solirubrobacteraceae bacterium]
MIPTRFDYHAPEDAAAAAQLLAEDPGGTRVLGGGTWVIPELSRGETRPRVVVDLAHAGLGGIEQTDNGLRIGAMTTYADLLSSDEVAATAPLLRMVAGEITGGWSLRNQGTIGGSAAAARPQSDIPAALVACDASAVIQGPTGVRRTPVARLIAGAMRTSLQSGELVTAFELPRWSSGAGYVKLKRYASSWPIVTASAGVTIRDGVCVAARLVLGGAAARPIVVDVTAVFVGEHVTPETIDGAAQAAADAVTEPWEDALAPGAYRAAIAAPAARRALTLACVNETKGA